MSGILNTTGAVSGILGTTVGTPSGGKVLQVAQYYSVDNIIDVTATGNFTALGNSYYTFPWSVTITTTQANSTVILLLQYGNIHQSSGAEPGNFSFKRTKDGTDEALVGAIDDATGTTGTPGYSSGGHMFGIARQGLADQRITSMRIMDAPADPVGTVLIYTPLAFVASGGMNVGWGSTTTFIVMEIAA